MKDSIIDHAFTRFVATLFVAAVSGLITFLLM
jgi:hypothetical protein